MQRALAGPQAERAALLAKGIEAALAKLQAAYVVEIVKQQTMAKEALAETRELEEELRELEALIQDAQEPATWAAAHEKWRQMKAARALMEAAAASKADAEMAARTQGAAVVAEAEAARSPPAPPPSLSPASHTEPPAVGSAAGSFSVQTEAATLPMAPPPAPHTESPAAGSAAGSFSLQSVAGAPFVPYNAPLPTSSVPYNAPIPERHISGPLAWLGS